MRLYKSRSLATQACDRGQVKLNAVEVKPSRDIGIGDAFEVRTPPIWRSFKVLSIPSSRVAAKLVSLHLEETTPFAELERREVARKVRSMEREPGTGRPTKRDRRRIDRYIGG